MNARSATAFFLFSALVFTMVGMLAARPAFPAADHLTFRVPVTLPGVTLAPGEYSFEVNYVDAGNVVQVHQRASRQLVFQGMTTRVQRPRARKAGSVVLGEHRSGEAAPVLVWYPRTTGIGFEFRHED
jgi:hypothetical protein